MEQNLVTDREIALFLLERIAELATGNKDFNLKDFIGSESELDSVIDFIDRKEKGKDWGIWYNELLGFLDTAKKAEVIAKSFSYHSIERSKEMAEDFAKKLEERRRNYENKRK